MSLFTMIDTISKSINKLHIHAQVWHMKILAQNTTVPQRRYVQREYHLFDKIIIWLFNTILAFSFSLIFSTSYKQISIIEMYFGQF